MIMKLIFPSGLAYAVIQMNPLAMVRDLGLDDDPEIVAAVAEMKPKKYLIYLEFVSVYYRVPLLFVADYVKALGLPLPKSRWCRYSMSPIGTNLRPMDRKYRLLPDMVVPIFPNTQYSSEDRPPGVRPTPSFPFSNCFHWIENTAEIRVRRRSNGELFDDARAVGLEAEEHVAMEYAFSKHYRRLGDFPSSDDTTSSPSEPTSLGTGSQPSIPPDALLNPQVWQACLPFSLSSRPIPSPESMSSGDFKVAILPQRGEPSRARVGHSLATQTRSDSDSSGGSSGTTLNEKKELAIEEISKLNLFGWDPDPTFPLLPLVDLWLELEEHISANDIPSPVDWYKEEEQIVS